ncbi:flavodoxin family protein [Chloroflexota bacterium]
MKVLGIVGSPRKGGNTEILVEEVLASAREAGAETEIFLVADKTINGCDGCGSCFKTGMCKIKDDMQQLYPRMEAADAIILGSPVYFHDVTAQAKAIIDRTFVYLADNILKGKVASQVLALRRVGGGQTRAHLYGVFIAHGMIPTRGAIGYGREKGDVRTGLPGRREPNNAMEEARAEGKDIIDMLNRLGVK